VPRPRRSARDPPRVSAAAPPAGGGGEAVAGPERRFDQGRDDERDRDGARTELPAEERTGHHQRSVEAEPHDPRSDGVLAVEPDEQGVLGRRAEVGGEVERHPDGDEDHAGGEQEHAARHGVGRGEHGEERTDADAAERQQPGGEPRSLTQPEPCQREGHDGLAEDDHAVAGAGRLDQARLEDLPGPDTEVGGDREGDAGDQAGDARGEHAPTTGRAHDRRRDPGDPGDGGRIVGVGPSFVHAPSCRCAPPTRTHPRDDVLVQPVLRPGRDAPAAARCGGRGPGSHGTTPSGRGCRLGTGACAGSGRRSPW
jgi:hypothetical protein